MLPPILLAPTLTAAVPGHSILFGDDGALFHRVMDALIGAEPPPVVVVADPDLPVAEPGKGDEAGFTEVGGASADDALPDRALADEDECMPVPVLMAPLLLTDAPPATADPSLTEVARDRGDRPSLMQLLVGQLIADQPVADQVLPMDVVPALSAVIMPEAASAPGLPLVAVQHQFASQATTPDAAVIKVDVAVPAQDLPGSYVPSRPERPIIRVVEAGDLVATPRGAAPPAARPAVPAVARDDVVLIMQDDAPHVAAFIDQEADPVALDDVPLVSPPRSSPMEKPPIAYLPPQNEAGGKRDVAGQQNVDRLPVFDLSPDGEKLSLEMIPEKPGPVALAVAGSGTPPDIPRLVARQMAVVISQHPGEATEIALNPEELGRVRMQITAADGSLMLHIAAERPETSDLMRRHVEMLAQEFRSLGFHDVAFSFSDRRRPDRDAGQPIAKPGHTPDEGRPIQPEPALRRQMNGALDLRL